MNNSVSGAIIENTEILNLEQQKKKKLLSIRTNLSYCKVSNRKCIGYRNEKNSSTYKEPCLFRFIIIRSD